MNRTSIDHLVEQLSRGELSRRSFVRRATALGLSAAAAGSLVRMASAQSTPAASPEASPAAYSGPTGVLSPSREEYQAALKEHFQFSEPEQTGEPGGQRCGQHDAQQLADLTAVVAADGRARALADAERAAAAEQGISGTGQIEARA